MISIIGAGRVGSAVAFLVGQSGLDDLVIVNRSKNKALGEALDISNALPEKSLISVVGTDDYSKMKNSDVVIITVSGGVIQEDRAELLPFNIPIVSDICKNLVKYADEAKVIVVTNPVDVMAYHVLRQTKFPRERVIGMGSSLDSSRFRYLVAKELGVKQGQIDGLVIGEHGSTMVPLFSNVQSQGQKINISEKKTDEITYELRNYWKYLVAYKEASVFGAAKNTFDITKSIVEGKDFLASASVYLDGEYGLGGFSMGVPVVFGKNGVKEILQLNIDEKESELLKLSAKKISDDIDKLSVFMK
ncbi:malate dehydrogenase [Candidatus Nitrosotalea bavarica]|uniref:malate dehydrogenase n=1 Tax=Candidatus Nitrosotalea bavarica TaxID=1903277 RepID=UPI000C71013C|nr:NAD(P)-binding domain-containing protein [Candidatus Nitrosotalea bavarica]